MIEPFYSALPVLKKLNDNGYFAYFVGGAVRDFIMEKEIHDVDIATSARPEEVMALFPKTVPVGIEHGTVLVVYNGQPYEVTTFRKEGKYNDFRHPSNVDFISRIEDDLSRRDFTMNAIAMDSDGNLIDPFFGQRDIKAKVIKTVGNPSERFFEDPLRMMRAIRFLSQLGFSLSKETEIAIKTNANLLQKISVERIKVEIEKMFLGKSCPTAIDLFIKLSIYKFIPEFYKYEDKIHDMITFNLANFKKTAEVWAFIILILHVENPDSFLKAWKSSRELIKDVRTILQGIKERQALREWSENLLYRYGLNYTFSIVRVEDVLLGHTQDLTTIEERYANLPIKNRNDIVVSGKDLLAWSGKKPGPWISNAFSQIEHAILKREIKNSKVEIREWLCTCSQILEDN